MADVATGLPGAVASKKSSKLALILALVLAIGGGGGSFYAIYSGMILGDGKSPLAEGQDDAAFTMPDVAFVALDPMVISIGPASDNRHLRFRASLEVPSQHGAAVQTILPRIFDMLNGYLRAVRIEDLEDPSALVRLRAQMLRRVQVITGPEAVRDLLIMEFVLN